MVKSFCFKKKKKKEKLTIIDYFLYSSTKFWLRARETTLDLTTRRWHDVERRANSVMAL